MSELRLKREFFCKDVLDVAPQLLGKMLVIQNRYTTEKFLITEVEAYRGEEDLACHASRGKTKRNEIMYAEGGHVYVYFIYGMYWMLNIVTGDPGNPQAVLIRGIKGYEGPGKLTRRLQIDGSYYGEDLVTSKKIWLEDNHVTAKIVTSARIGIDYAGDIWKSKPWRFLLQMNP